MDKAEVASPSRIWKAALYARLSREDEDRLESNSIANQKALLAAYAAKAPDLRCVQLHIDDGYTGTNFDRPGFQDMIQSIETGQIDCVIVKDLSRFGRDYINTGYYLERWFPNHGVRFISINDHIDSAKGSYDMMLPLRNVFNDHYARDISQKVCSSVRAKQERGQFVGAFASYGYRKSPQDRNKLELDPVAAQVVRRIFTLFESGMGKVSIAKTLNAEGIPCPSEYKRLNGDKYSNGQKIDSTTYWTYPTIHRILQNSMYIGTMEQGRAPRVGMHGPAKKLPKNQWVTIPHTHEAIIDQAQWDRVQQLLQKNSRQPIFDQNISPFAGYLKCGDCGRAMCKTRSNNKIRYGCGSYKRYGASVCTGHYITHEELASIVLEDLNRIIDSVRDLTSLAEESVKDSPKRDLSAERDRLQAGLDRLYRLKKTAYEDYREGLITKEDYLRYKADYEGQENHLSSQLELLAEQQVDDPLDNPWVKALLQHGRLTELDRATIAETIEQIKVFEDGRLEITYRFADDLGLFSSADTTYEKPGQT